MKILSECLRAPNHEPVSNAPLVRSVIIILHQFSTAHGCAPVFLSCPCPTRNALPLLIFTFWIIIIGSFAVSGKEKIRLALPVRAALQCKVDNIITIIADIERTTASAGIPRPEARRIVAIAQNKTNKHGWCGLLWGQPIVPILPEESFGTMLH